MNYNRLRIFVIFLVIPVILFSQKRKIARWSIMPEYGYLVFDGDINQQLNELFPSSLTNQVLGLNIGYAFDPIWGAAIDGYFFPARAINKSPIPLFINTNIYNGDFVLTVNLSKLIFPNLKPKLHFIAGAGLGYAYYTYSLKNYPDGTPLADNTTYNDIKYSGQTKPVKLTDGNGVMDHGNAISIPVYLALEYNFSKPFAIGVKFDYRSYNKDNLEGVTYLNWNGVTNDYVGFGSVYVRYKIGAIKRDHLRNITMKEYREDEFMPLIAGINNEIAGLKGRVGAVEDKVNQMLPRLDKLETLIKNEGPDSDNDGVIDMRDLEPNTPPNTPVDFYGRTQKVTVVTKADNTQSDRNITDIPTLYFNFDGFNLDDDALVVISRIAKLMTKDKSLLVEVRGFTDYLGDAGYNEKLSLKRAERVKNELVKVWGIESDRIIANGKGRVIQPQVKYRPNRRCEFYFSNDIVDNLNE